MPRRAFTPPALASFLEEGSLEDEYSIRVLSARWCRPSRGVHVSYNCKYMHAADVALTLC